MIVADHVILPVLRMYYPKETSPSILDGSRSIPPVVKVN
jgi:hypothetical protein